MHDKDRSADLQVTSGLTCNAQLCNAGSYNGAVQDIEPLAPVAQQAQRNVLDNQLKHEDS